MSCFLVEYFFFCKKQISFGIGDSLNIKLRINNLNIAFVSSKKRIFTNKKRYETTH